MFSQSQYMRGMKKSQEETAERPYETAAVSTLSCSVKFNIYLYLNVTSHNMWQKFFVRAFQVSEFCFIAFKIPLHKIPGSTRFLKNKLHIPSQVHSQVFRAIQSHSEEFWKSRPNF